MATVVTWEISELWPILRRRQRRIEGEVSHTRVIALESLVELIARPALRLLVTVPFGGEIDGFRIVRRIGKAMHDKLLLARLLQSRKLKTPYSAFWRYGIGVLIFGRRRVVVADILSIVVTTAHKSHSEARHNGEGKEPEQLFWIKIHYNQMDWNYINGL